MTTACEPGRFCPHHPVEPGLLVLIAATVIAVTLFTAGAGFLVWALCVAARRIRHRLTRTRRDRDRYAAAITRVRTGHHRNPNGLCAYCYVRWPCPLLCRLAGPPCTPDCHDWHTPLPEPTPPRPYRDVMAAAVEDWWTTTDPTTDTATGPDIAAHVDMYLTSSGYHITPNPRPPRARTRLRSARAIAGTRAHANTTPTRK